MTEQQVSGTSSPSDPESANASYQHRDFAHPSAAEMAEAVAATEEINEADETYVAELAALDEVDQPAADSDLLPSAGSESAGVGPDLNSDAQLVGAPDPFDGVPDTLTDDAAPPAATEALSADPPTVAEAPEPASAVEEAGSVAEDPEPATQDQRPVTQDLEPVTQDLEPGVQDLEPGGQDVEPGGQDVEPGAQDPEPGAQDPEPGAQDPEPGAQDLELEPADPAEAQSETGQQQAEAAAAAEPEFAPAESAADSTATPDTPAVEPTAETLTAEAAAESDLIPVPEADPGLTFPVSPRPKPQRPGKPQGPVPGGSRRPSPIPRPTPVPPLGGTPVHVAPELPDASDPTPWGRVDEKGTVFVKTEDGEREVGFWQAGDPASGLAHYGRRYDDFITEIVVLETRLANHSGDPKAARTHAQMLRQSIDTLPAVGDLTSAAARLDAVVTAADQAIADAVHERASTKAAAVARREALCVEAEELAESNQWKSSGDRLKEIVEEWRTIRGIDRKTDDQLWKRFSKARDTFIRRRGSHFAEMDKERGAAKGVKEKLIARAEELAESTDWAATATDYRTLMTEWKAAGRTSRDVEDALWDRFRAAQEKFFSRRQETFASRDAEFETNAAAKEALLVEAEKINPARGLDAAKAALRSIQDRWEAAGKVPRERIRTLDARLRAVEERVKTAEDSLWRKTDPETTARLAQFRSRYEAYLSQAEKATASGDSKRAAAAQAQANQWLEWLRAAENAVD